MQAMSTIPSLIIVADRGHVIAYERQNTGSYQVVHSHDIEEGLQKLSEQVTDKAGRFPDLSTNGKGNSSAERLNLKAEIEMQTFRKIVQYIQEWFQGEFSGRSWGFAAPAEINNAILDGLNADLKARISYNLKLNLTGMPAQEVVKHFSKVVEYPVPVSAG